VRVLRARYASGKEFLAFYLTTPAEGGMFYPTREALSVGQEMAVEVRFPGLVTKTVLRGRVAWRRRGRHRSKLRAGVGIEFLAGETRKCEFLLRVAKGERVSIPKRRHRRIPAAMDVIWRLKDEPHRAAGLLDNIGLGGAFLRTAVAAPEGRDIILSLAPPGAACPVELEGRIAWCERSTPGSVSMGVQFKARDIGGVRRLKELVRRVESGVAPVLPYFKLAE
jgi:Tfp pilus assembly protein PilZ